MQQLFKNKGELCMRATSVIKYCVATPVETYEVVLVLVRVNSGQFSQLKFYQEEARHASNGSCCSCSVPQPGERRLAFSPTQGQSSCCTKYVFFTIQLPVSPFPHISERDAQ